MITFHELYERYAPDVYRFAYSLAGNSMDADDLTSETFVRAWTSKANIRTETVKAYLFTITRNLYLEQLRKARRNVPVTTELADPAPGPDSQVGHRLQLSGVLETLYDLPEIDRTAFILRVQHQLPYAEIARTLDLSLSAAKVKVHRIRLKLAAMHLEHAMHLKHGLHSDREET